MHRCAAEGEIERLESRLTDSDCSHHWGHDDRECHSTSDHQVPLVVGDIFAFIAVMDLTEIRGAMSHGQKKEREKSSSHK